VEDGGKDGTSRSTRPSTQSCRTDPGRMQSSIQWFPWTALTPGFQGSSRTPGEEEGGEDEAEEGEGNDDDDDDDDEDMEYYGRKMYKERTLTSNAKWRLSNFWGGKIDFDCRISSGMVRFGAVRELSTFNTKSGNYSSC
jgi:hypothetical protein